MSCAALVGLWRGVRVSPAFDTGICVSKWLQGLQRGVIGVRKSWSDYRQQCWSRMATSVHCTGSSKNNIEDGVRTRWIGPTAKEDGRCGS